MYTIILKYVGIHAIHYFYTLLLNHLPFLRYEKKYLILYLQVFSFLIFLLSTYFLQAQSSIKGLAADKADDLFILLIIP